MDQAIEAPVAAQASEDFLRLIPHEFARAHTLLSLGRTESGAERLLVSESSDANAIFNVGVRLGRTIKTDIADAEQIAAQIDAAYEAKSGGSAVAEAADRAVVVEEAVDLDRMLDRTERDLLATGGKAPVVRLVDALLFNALQLGASDLHVQPLAERVVIRHRVDGVLGPGRDISNHLLKPLVSRIKVLGRMDVSERLIPQDGRTTIAIGDRNIDVRISTMPTPHGERVVLRLLDTRNQLQAFHDVGMPKEVAQPFLDSARRASGIILVTGPTGSGKTTTLYSTLRELDSRERNIMTIEDPIEYELDTLGLPISQSQVNTRKGVTFANGLRHILRQDPDVILVGEIRDAETAKIAIQSSLTGHLVFSTLHTNDAVSAVTRLIDLGVEPYLVSASLSAVLAQRLVRRVCPDCQVDGTVDGTLCPTCRGSGFRGRIAVFELLMIDETLRELIAARAPLEDLRRAAEQAEMKTLSAAGAELVAQGLTTSAEVERVVHG